MGIEKISPLLEYAKNPRALSARGGVSPFLPSRLPGKCSDSAWVTTPVQACKTPPVNGWEEPACSSLQPVLRHCIGAPYPDWIMRFIIYAPLFVGVSSRLVFSDSICPWIFHEDKQGESFVRNSLARCEFFQYPVMGTSIFVGEQM